MKISAAIILITLFLPVASTAIEYHVDKSANNQVQFTPRTPLQDFEVTTSSIDGYASWPGKSFPPASNQFDGSEFYFEVQLNSLDAGNSMYNRHMKENYLETDEFPYASYKGTIDSVSSDNDTLHYIYSNGQFNIHGENHPIEIIGIVTGSGEQLQVRCDFIILLSSHDIEVPKLMFMETDERINVILSFKLKVAK